MQEIIIRNYTKTFNKIVSIAFRAMDRLDADASKKIFSILEKHIEIIQAINPGINQRGKKRHTEHFTNLTNFSNEVSKALQELVNTFQEKETKSSNKPLNREKLSLLNSLGQYQLALTLTIKKLSSSTTNASRSAVKKPLYSEVREEAKKHMGHNPAIATINIPFDLSLNTENQKRLASAREKLNEKSDNNTSSSSNSSSVLASPIEPISKSEQSDFNDETVQAKLKTTKTIKKKHQTRPTRESPTLILEGETKNGSGSDSQTTDQNTLLELENNFTVAPAHEITPLDPYEETQKPPDSLPPTKPKEKILIAEEEGLKKLHAYEELPLAWRNTIEGVISANAQGPERTWPQFWKMVAIKSLVVAPLYAGFITLGIFTGKILIAPLINELGGVLFDAAAKLGPIAPDYPSSNQLMEEALDRFLQTLGIDIGLNSIYLAFGMHAAAHRYSQQQVLANITVKNLREMAEALLKSNEEEYQPGQVDLDQENEQTEQEDNLPTIAGIAEKIDATYGLRGPIGKLNKYFSKKVDKLFGAQKNEDQAGETQPLLPTSTQAQKQPSVKPKKNRNGNFIDGKLSVYELALLRLKAHKRGNHTESSYADDVIIEIFLLAYNGFDAYTATDYSSNYFKTGLLKKEQRQGIEGNTELAKKLFSDYLETIYSLDKNAYAEIAGAILVSLKDKLKTNAESSGIDALIPGITAVKEGEKKALEELIQLEIEHNRILSQQSNSTHEAKPKPTEITFEYLLNPDDKLKPSEHAAWKALTEHEILNKAETEILYGILDYNQERKSSIGSIITIVTSFVAATFLVPWASSDALQSIGESNIGKGNTKLDTFEVLAQKFDSVANNEGLLAGSAAIKTTVWGAWKGIFHGKSWWRQRYILSNNQNAICALLAADIASPTKTHSLSEKSFVTSSTATTRFLYQAFIKAPRQNYGNISATSESVGRTLFLAAHGMSKKADEFKYNDDQSYVPVKKQSAFDGDATKSFTCFKRILSLMEEDFSSIAKDSNSSADDKKTLQSQQTQQLASLIMGYMNAQPPKPVSTASNWTFGLADWFSRKDSAEIAKINLIKAKFINSLVGLINNPEKNASKNLEKNTREAQPDLLTAALKSIKPDELKKWKKTFEQTTTPGDEISKAKGYIQTLLDGKFFEEKDKHGETQIHKSSSILKEIDPPKTLPKEEKVETPLEQNRNEKPPETRDQGQQAEKYSPTLDEVIIANIDDIQTSLDWLEKASLEPEIKEGKQEIGQELNLDDIKLDLTQPNDKNQFIDEAKTVFSQIFALKPNQANDAKKAGLMQELAGIIASKSSKLEDFSFKHLVQAEADKIIQKNQSPLGQLAAFDQLASLSVGKLPENSFFSQLLTSKQITHFKKLAEAAFTEILNSDKLKSVEQLKQFRRLDQLIHGKLRITDISSLDEEDKTILVHNTGEITMGFKHLIRRALNISDPKQKSGDRENKLFNIFSTEPNPYLYRLLVEEEKTVKDEKKEPRLHLLISNTTKKPPLDFETLLKHTWEFCKDTSSHEKDDKRKAKSTSVNPEVRIKNFIMRITNLFFALPEDYYNFFAKKYNLVDPKFWEEMIQFLVKVTMEDFSEEEALIFKERLLNSLHLLLTEKKQIFDNFTQVQNDNIIPHLPSIVQSEQIKLYFSLIGDTNFKQDKSEIYPNDSKLQQLQQLQRLEGYIGVRCEREADLAAIINLMTDDKVVNPDEFNKILDRNELITILGQKLTSFSNKKTVDPKEDYINIFVENLYNKYVAAKKAARPSWVKLSSWAAPAIQPQPSVAVAISRLSRFFEKLEFSGVKLTGLQTSFFASLAQFKNQDPKFIDWILESRKNEFKGTPDPFELFEFIPSAPTNSHSTSFQKT